MLSIIIYLTFFNICAVLKWGLGGFAPDKRGVGGAMSATVGTQTLCLPRFSGSSTVYSSLIKQRTAKNIHAVALLTLALTMQALFVVGNVSRRLSEELPFVDLFLYIGASPFSKNTDRGIMKKA